MADANSETVRDEEQIRVPPSVAGDAIPAENDSGQHGSGQAGESASGLPHRASRRGDGKRRGRLGSVGTALTALAILTVVALGLAIVAWPRPSLGESPSGLGTVQLRAFAGAVTSVSAHTPQGAPVPLSLRNGSLVPSGEVEQGQLLTVEFTVAPPSWAAWLVGRTRSSSAHVTTPSSRVDGQWITVRAGATPRVRFAQPVRVVKFGAAQPQVLAAPQSEVALPAAAGGAQAAGVVEVAAAVQPWERLSEPLRVAWFPADTSPEVLAEPGTTSNSAEPAPSTPLTLTFSAPVRQVMGDSTPRISPKTSGSWQAIDAHTLSFVPSGRGFALGATVRVDLPTPVRMAGRQSGALSKELAWKVRPASTLRLQQLFAELGYLPLGWEASGSPTPDTEAGQYEAAAVPPAGSFKWLYPKSTPKELRRLWHPGIVDEITLGAIMTFEDEHHMPADEHAGPLVWAALIRDAIAGTRHQAGYSYVYVHSQVPTSLNLWHDGKVILTSPGNTGVPAAPTQMGTFQVFEHIPVGTMSGTNPSGSHYNDPGIRWISYFNHGEAIHAFNRASFGTPQSLGCVELPLEAAKKVWPYTPIGTLVTVEQ
jgi:hypothetical protein